MCIRDRHLCPGMVGCHFDGGTQLLCQGLNDGGAQARLGGIRACGHPDAIVRHGKDPVRGVDLVSHHYLALPILRKSMLERIYDQLGDD